MCVLHGTEGSQRANARGNRPLERRQNKSSLSELVSPRAVICKPLVLLSTKGNGWAAEVKCFHSVVPEHHISPCGSVHMHTSYLRRMTESQ